MVMAKTILVCQVGVWQSAAANYWVIHYHVEHGHGKVDSLKLPMLYVQSAVGGEHYQQLPCEAKLVAGRIVNSVR